MNRYIDIRYSIVEFNMSLLTVKLQLGLLYRKVWINWSSPWDKICSFILLILFKKVCLGLWKFGRWRRKCVVVSVLLPQSKNGFRVSWKQFLTLRSRRWLKTSRNLVFPYGLWILKILFTQGLIKFSRFFLKIKRLSESLISQSRLFHWDIAEGKN